MKIGIYSPNWIGDAVMSLSFIQILRSKYPDAEIMVFCKEWVSAVYDNNPAINQILPFSVNEISGFTNIVRTGRKLKKYNFDKFFTLTDSFRSALISWLSGSIKRYGYKAQMRTIFLTDALKISNKNIHRSQKYIELIQCESTGDLKPKISLSNSQARWAEKEIKKIGLSDPVALLPFSVSSDRTIPNYILIKWIKNTKNNYLVFGSKEDKNKAKRLVNLSKSPSIKSICGNYSLKQSIAMIAACNFSLATDSGMGHISAALGIPTISFFGKGNHDITGPKGAKISIIKHCRNCIGNQCINSENRKCIKTISRSDIDLVLDNLINT